MLVILLVGALVAQTSLAAPSTNCGELCDDHNSGSFGQSKSSSSYSTYSKSSYGHGTQGLPSSGNLGLTSGRLENLDENVIGLSGLDRPGNWQDEKHYVTNDGKGQMSYRTGQSVSNNGYSKYAEHSYSYGSHESHAPLSNSQVLTTEQFGHEMQSIRNRINNFMGHFHVGIGSNVNANLLQDFKSKASLISKQLNNVCNQVDVGSSMHQQMQLMMNQFQRDVEQKQREMESIIYQNSGSSSSSTTHGSAYRFPTATSNQYEDQFSTVQALISSFYSTFNRPDTNLQFQQDLNTQVDTINSKLADLNFESAQNESDRKRIDHLKKQFEDYVSQILIRIHEIEQRNLEEEAKRKDRELQLKLEKQQQEEKLRQEQLLRLQEEERIRLQHQEEERLRLQQQEKERVRLQHQEEERLRLQHQEEERLRLQHQEEERLRLQHQEEERLRLQHQQEEENKRIWQEQDDRARLALLHQQQPQQNKVKITGSATYEHSMTGSFSGAQTQGGSSGYTESYNYGAHSKPQPVIQPHVDLTAAMSRLQQDLNRLQTEVNNFNMYTMRLTSANSVTIVGEAERQAEQLRERINNLCETSNRYQNQNIQSSAEDLGRRFEELFRSFQNQAANYSAQGGSAAFSAGYSSESSYGMSGHYGAVRKPAITNVEYEHSKSVDVEVGRRPATLPSHTSTGSAYSSINSYGAQGADGQYRTGLIDLGQNGSGARHVECVEMYAGQPCVQQPLLRYRRYLGEDYNSFSDLSQKTTDSQQHQQILTDITQHSKSNPAQKKFFNDQTQRPKPQIHDLHKIEDLTHQAGDVDDFYLHQMQKNQEHSSINSENAEFKQKTEDLSQKNIQLKLIEELESLKKSENKNTGVTPHTNNQIQLPKSINLETDINFQITTEQNRFNYKSPYQQDVLPTTTKSLHMRPMTILEKYKKEIQKLQTHPLAKLESNQETEKFTLENSGFNNYQQYSEIPKTLVNQYSDQLSKIKEQESAQKSENFSLEKSGFNDYFSQNGNLKLNIEPKPVQPLVSKNFEMHQETENQVTDKQNLEFDHLNNQATGQHNNILSQQQQPSYQSNQPSKNENILTTTGSQELISTVHPTVKPLIKPTPRYTKPWQVSQNHILSSILHINQKQTESENVQFEQNLNQSDLSSDLKASTPQSVDYKFHNNDYNSQQQQQEVNLYENSQLPNLQKPKNYDQINHQSKPIKLNEEQRFVHHNNKNQENIDENEQKDFNQQTQDILLKQPSLFDQQQDKASLSEQKTSHNLKDNLTGEKVSVNKTKTLNVDLEMEPTTTPNTFWKRVGHKLSDSYDKLKEKTKNIFG